MKAPPIAMGLITQLHHAADIVRNYITKTKSKTIALAIPRVTNNYECYPFAIRRCPLMGTRLSGSIAWM